MKKELAYDKCCFYCEKGRPSEDESSVYCTKKKKEVAPGEVCHAFFYDLLRRRPMLPTLPSVELPPLD